MQKTILAIDPGQSGGIAILNGALSAAHSMPETEGDILWALRAAKDGSETEPVAYIEEVGGFVAGNPAPGSAMFRFGEHFGFIKGCLQSLGFRIVTVRSQAWQKTLALGGTGIAKTDTPAQREAKKRDWKNKLKAEAQRRHPHLKVTLSTADALLILEHAIQAERL